MEKIKGLLLFGILTLLGIGSSCFAVNKLNYSYCISNGETLPCYSYSINREYSPYQLSLSPLYFGNTFLSNNYSYSSGVSYYGTSSINNLAVSDVSFNVFQNPGFGFFNGYDYNAIDRLPSFYSYLDGNFNGSYNMSSRMIALKINLDSLNFFGFSRDNWLDFNNFTYRFVGDTYYTGFDLLSDLNSGNDISYHGTLTSLFFGDDVSFSTIYSTGNTYKFFTVLDDGFILDSDNKLLTFGDSIISDVLVVPLRNPVEYGFTGDKTIIIGLNDGNFIYNLFDCFSSKSSELQNCNIISKGYINDFESLIYKSGYSTFKTFTRGTSKYNESYIYNIINELYLYSGGIVDVNYNYFYDYNSSITYSNVSDLYNYRYKTFSFTEDSSVPVILFPGGNGNQSIPNVNSNSLYYNCLGPTYNTPDGLPPKYCFNSSGEFQGDFLKNCYLSFDGLNQYVYCYNDGFQQEVEFIENGSGYDIVACDGCSTNILDWLNEGYSTGYFENFLNTTGYFFKCPFPYSESLTVWPKLISMMNGFDINLPINCAFAGFAQGKQVFIFEHSGHLIQGGPLLNFEGDNRKLLYTFFDFLIILGLLFFFGKILKFFS